MNYFVLSLAVHLIFLIGLVNAENPKRSSPPPQSITLVQQKPKPRINKAMGAEIRRTGSDGQRDCKNYYGGIGVYYSVDSNMNNVITNVIPGYPADEIGLQPGDTIVESENINGTPGTMVTFQVIRNGIISSHMVKRAKVCLDR